jgi:hypothetical protein
MTREQALVLAAVAVGAVLACMLSPWSPLAQQAAVQSGGQGTTWAPYHPRVPYYQRGGLYHPPVAGLGRTCLLLYGWDWIASPPSEITGPGVEQQ